MPQLIPSNRRTKKMSLSIYQGASFDLVVNNLISICTDKLFSIDSQGTVNYSAQSEISVGNDLMYALCNNSCRIEIFTGFQWQDQIHDNAEFGTVFMIYPIQK
jgi:hypothetical protein